MREFIIEITDRVQDSELEALTQPSIIHKAGIAGEHKASRLVFCLPESWDSEWTYVVECVNSMGEGTPSEKLSVVEKDGKRTVKFDIPRSMTEMGSGDYVLEAILYDGEEVAKIIRSATVRVGIEKSPTFKKRVVDAIRGIYEELIAKLETIVNQFNNGEFNGATFTPSVSVGGDLSWSNDKNLANPETVNIKGEKGDKGDKGDDGKNGEDGKDGVDGKDGKDGAGKDIPLVFALPEDAEDGDMCLLALIDGIPGKTVQLDWNNLMLAAKANEGNGFTTYFYLGEEFAGEITGFYFEPQDRVVISLGNYNLEFYCYVEFINGKIDTDVSTTTELPEYFTFPYFDRVEGLQYGIALNWFSVPLRLMIYNGEWNDSGLTPEQLEALNANTAARHTHDNYWSLSDLRCEASEVEQGGNNPLPILPDYVGVDRPTFRSNYLSYCSDGAVIGKVEEKDDGEKFLRLWLYNGPVNTNFDVPDFIDIPVKAINEKVEESPSIGTNGAGLEVEFGGTSGGLTPEQAADLAANTVARHEHENKDTLDDIHYDKSSRSYVIGGDIIYTTANADRIFIARDDAEAIIEQHVIDTVGNALTDITNALTGINARIDGIEGGINEIEAMIDESGVLGE